MGTNVEIILEGMKTFLQTAHENRQKYFVRVQDFTRERQLTLNILCFFMISQSKRSLSIELEDFFKRIGEACVTKGAFSKARYRLHHALFKDWNHYLIKSVYALNAPNLLRWKGLNLKAIDGTSLSLFHDEEVIKEFGGQSNQHGTVPMARAGIELDPLNGYVTQAQLQPYSVGEASFAEAFLKNSAPKDLRIYDRLFASFALIFMHLQVNAFFLMRCKVHFNNVVKKFVESGKKQCIVDFPITESAKADLLAKGYDVDGKTSVRVRLLRIDIGRAEPEILITNLLDLKKYPHACFKELYNYRWGDETRFDQIKNKLQVEIFSGHKPQAIYQDFYTTIIASNLHNLICQENQERLEQINQAKQEKNENTVAINQNVSIGILKTRLVQLFMDKEPKQIIAELTDIFLRHLEPIRLGRKNPRTKKIRNLNGKYQTFKNYRRAA